GHDRTRSHHWLSIVMLAVLPLGSIAIYFGVGSPGVSSVPYLARFEQNPKTATLENLVAQIERHLRTNPGDAKGWDIIGRPFMRLGRYRDAANAFDQAIKLDRPTAARLASYGEALVFAANGMVEAKARAAFEQSVALEADYSQARYYLGLAAFQSRDFESSIATWQAMLDGPGPKQDSWRKEVTDQVVLAKRLQAEDTGSSEPPVAGAAPGTGLVATAPPPPGPTAQDVEAAQSMTPEQQRNLIESMVARLATRLESKGDDIDGWVRLLRAYGVLGKADEAKAALLRAREIFTGDPVNLERLRAIVPET
ncbi:MAG: tetratricopeptide repeat protein, partial [Hyphomicrobiales bacterium]